MVHRSNGFRLCKRPLERAANKRAPFWSRCYAQQGGQQEIGGASIVIKTRLNGDLAVLMGVSRLSVSLSESATVEELLHLLHRQYPAASARLNTAVTIVDGRHASLADRLEEGQEVAFLVPIAGG